MEASGALGQGAADGGQADAQQQGEAGGQDFGQIMETLSQVSQGQEEMRQFLASQPWQPEPQPEPEQLPQYGDPNDPAYGAEDEQVAQYLQELTKHMTEQQVKQALEPFTNQLQDVRMSQEAQQLVDEFPELGDPEVANEVAGPQGVAVQYANLLGKPELASEPRFWRLCYLAGRAAEAANEEGAETPDAAMLEGGNGARPAAPQLTTEQFFSRDEADDGGLGRRVLNFD